VNTIMNLRVPEIAGKFLSSYAIGGFSRRFSFMKLVNSHKQKQLINTRFMPETYYY
jgi:hypothetical protein